MTLNTKIKNLKNKDLLVLESVAGSHLYGTYIEGSDLDIRGIFIPSFEEIMNLNGFVNEISDEKSDIKYYALNKFFMLAKDCNPNIVELLFLPNDAIRYKNWVYDLIYKNRHLFISKKAKHTFTGYAVAQIKKSKSQSKKANNIDNYTVGINGLRYDYLNDPDKVLCLMGGHCVKFLEKTINEPAFEEDYSSMIPKSFNDFIYFYGTDVNGFQFRPKKFDLNIDEYDISSVEGSGCFYRLYKNGSGFIKNNNVICASISKEREISDFVGVISINVDEYKKSKSDFDSFWEWMANRNEQRYKTAWDNQDKADYKNLMHTFRLLICSKNIALNGEPIVRVDNKTRDFLLDIRNGKFCYNYLLNTANDLLEEVDELFEKSSLDYSADFVKINKLYMEIVNEYYRKV